MQSVRLYKIWSFASSNSFSSTLLPSNSTKYVFILFLKLISVITIALISMWQTPRCHSDGSSDVNSSQTPFLTTLFNAATTTTHHSLSHYLFYFPYKTSLFLTILLVSSFIACLPHQNICSLRAGTFFLLFTTIPTWQETQ